MLYIKISGPEVSWDSDLVSVHASSESGDLVREPVRPGVIYRDQSAEKSREM